MRAICHLTFRGLTAVLGLGLLLTLAAPSAEAGHPRHGPPLHGGHGHHHGGHGDHGGWGHHHGWGHHFPHGRHGHRFGGFRTPGAGCR